MRYPNTRYGNPNEMLIYTRGLSVKDIAKMLKRSEKTVHSWLQGTNKVPFWVPELLRLRHEAHIERLRRMGMMSDFQRWDGTRHLRHFSSHTTEAANDATIKTGRQRPDFVLVQ